MKNWILYLPLLLGVPAVASEKRTADEWPHWRGPGGTGYALGSAPLEWSDDKNVKWKLPVPGRGFSTPVVWKEKLFLTTAVPLQDAPDAEPPEESRGEGRGGFKPGGLLVEHAFIVMCVDRATGKVLWEKVATKATPHEGFHKTFGSYASISPVTDGKHLYASFGSFGLFCFDLDGKELWKTDFGVKMEMRRQFGEGSGPVLHGDTLVEIFDQEGDSFIVAVDKQTGKEKWRVARDELSTWAAPLITEYDGAPQVITSGDNRVRAYALETGELIWECDGLGTNAIPIPQRQDDTVLVMSGHRDVKLMAIRLGGKGDLTDSDAVVWSTTKGTAYTASPVLHDGKFYSVHDRGLLSCFDARTGKAFYQEERLPRGSSLKASPVGADGKLYIATESGDVHVVKMGPEFEVIRTNSLEDQFFIASPIVVEGEIFLRSETDLFCIAGGAETTR